MNTGHAVTYIICSTVKIPQWCITGTVLYRKAELYFTANEHWPVTYITDDLQYCRILYMPTVPTQYNNTTVD